jgi:hypothetical protein
MNGRMGTIHVPQQQPVRLTPGRNVPWALS